MTLHLQKRAWKVVIFGCVLVVFHVGQWARLLMKLLSYGIKGQYNLAINGTHAKAKGRKANCFVSDLIALL
jgi:hypothetical protein